MENPKNGDDTRYILWFYECWFSNENIRQWGPPYLKDKETGEDIKGESAYFHCANRNKKSITVDLQKVEGQNIIKKLAATSDIVIENFRVGKLKEYGLGYEDLKQVKPDIIYASVTGYGQNVIFSCLYFWIYFIHQNFCLKSKRSSIK